MKSNFYLLRLFRDLPLYVDCKSCVYNKFCSVKHSKTKEIVCNRYRAKFKIR